VYYKKGFCTNNVVAKKVKREDEEDKARAKIVEGSAKIQGEAWERIGRKTKGATGNGSLQKTAGRCDYGIEGEKKENSREGRKG